jgi:protein TonB
MFANLIESESHKQDFARKSSFFLATLLVYAALLLLLGAISIYAYDAHLESQNLELTTLVAPVEQPFEELSLRHTSTSQSAAADHARQLSERQSQIARVDDSTKPPETISADRFKIPEMPHSLALITSRNVDVTSFDASAGPPRPGNTDGASSNPSGKQTVRMEEIELPPARPEERAAPKRVISKGVLNGQAIKQPNAVYPAIARAAHIEGIVEVQILVDESGKVISARAVSGHPLLQASAVQAAYQTRFSPTLLSEEPVKVSGTITFNFTLR